MSNMTCSRRVRGGFKLGSWCYCCDWVHNSKTARIARRIVRRKEKVVWRKDQNI